MKAVVTTSITTTVQYFTKKGDRADTPILFSDKQTFETEQEVDNFIEHIDLWTNEYPKPNGSFDPFRRVKAPATEDHLMGLLDEIHGPMDLWLDHPLYVPSEHRYPEGDE